MSDLIVITYDSNEGAMVALDEVASLQKLQLIELENAMDLGDAEAEA